MSSLPLFRPALISETGVMSSTESVSPNHRSWSQLLRSAALTIASVVSECNRASRMMTQVRLAPDRYLPDSGQAPDDYAEFLFRTSGPLAHEPSARQRLAAGRSHR
jgi:hypothetical protein